MPYVTMKEIVDRAYKEHYGVPAVSGFDELSVRAAIEAAEETNSPLIMISGNRSTHDAVFFGNMVESIANKASIPVAACLDHSPSFEDAILGLRGGYSAIMIDRSSLPYEQNAADVKELARIAHAIGVSVEAELGHVGSGDNYAVDGSTALTVPEEAKKFIEETGVDCLAVAIGSAHGAYKGTPKLRFELLQEIDAACKTPLVLHGGSGTGDENIHHACELGICKVNIANDLFKAAYTAVSSKDMSGNGVYGFFPTIFNAMKNHVKHTFDVTGCTGKAWATKPMVFSIHAPQDMAEA